MLGGWRLIQRQAEEAARIGRYEQALALLDRAGAAEHRRAIRLRQRIADRLVRRAGKQLAGGHSQAAWADLAAAERAGAQPTELAQVRQQLLQRRLAELRRHLAAGNPQQARQLADQLHARGVECGELRVLRQVACLWEQAVTSRRAGRFEEAIDRLVTAHRLAGDNEALAEAMARTEGQASRACQLRAELSGQLAAGDWPGVLRSAEALLALAPECAQALWARDLACRHLGQPLSGLDPDCSPGQSAPDSPTVRGTHVPQERSILWVDGVGGFLVCMGRSITIGQAAPGNCLDVPVLGDLSSLHATISRDGEGYVVQTQRDVFVNGRPVGQAALRDGDEIRLGRKVQMRFRMPCPLSGTATLTLVSGHRLHLALSAIVLLAETCLIGPSEQAHIPVPDSATTLTLYRQPDGLWCRTEGELEIDGRAYDGRGPLRPGSHAVAGELSFSVESLNWPLNQL